MTNLFVDHTQATGYVQPYPLADAASLVFTLFTYQDVSPTAFPNSLTDVTTYLINKTLQRLDLTIPSGQNKYIYIGMSQFIGQIGTVIFNNFPVRLVSMGKVSYGSDGFGSPHYLYRTEYPQNGNNIVISILDTGLIRT